MARQMSHTYRKTRAKRIKKNERRAYGGVPAGGFRTLANRSEQYQNLVKDGIIRHKTIR